MLSSTPGQVRHVADVFTEAQALVDRSTRFAGLQGGEVAADCQSVQHHASGHRRAVASATRRRNRRNRVHPDHPSTSPTEPGYDRGAIGVADVYDAFRPVEELCTGRSERHGRRGAEPLGDDLAVFIKSNGINDPVKLEPREAARRDGVGDGSTVDRERDHPRGDGRLVRGDKSNLGEDRDEAVIHPLFESDDEAAGMGEPSLYAGKKARRRRVAALHQNLVEPVQRDIAEDRHDPAVPVDAPRVGATQYAREIGDPVLVLESSPLGGNHRVGPRWVANEPLIDRNWPAPTTPYLPRIRSWSHALATTLTSLGLPKQSVAGSNPVSRSNPLLASRPASACHG